MQKIFFSYLKGFEAFDLRAWRFIHFGFVARGYFLFLLSIFACRRAGRIDARGPQRIHAERNAHRHSRLQISNARSLTVHSDLGELCDRERPGRVLVAYSNRVTSYA